MKIIHTQPNFRCEFIVLLFDITKTENQINLYILHAGNCLFLPQSVSIEKCWFSELAAYSSQRCVCFMFLLFLSPCKKLVRLSILHNIILNRSAKSKWDKQNESERERLSSSSNNNSSSSHTKKWNQIICFSMNFDLS